MKKNDYPVSLASLSGLTRFTGSQVYRRLSIAKTEPATSAEPVQYPGSGQPQACLRQGPSLPGCES